MTSRNWLISNKNFSIIYFMIFQYIQMTALFIYGLLIKDKFRVAMASGTLSGLIVIIKAGFKKRYIIKYIEENT